MTRRLVSAAWAGLIGALASVVLLALFYVLQSVLRLEFDIDPPRMVTGIFPSERDQATGLTYAWTGKDVALRLPGLDRRVEWSLTLRVRGGRQVREDNPAVALFVDGVHALTHQTRTEFDEIRVALPRRPERPRGALVTLQSSGTFVPGPQDPRPLGVMVDAVTIAPEGLALPPWPALAGVAWAGAALGIAMALLGSAPGLAVAAVVLIALGQSAIAARGFAPFTDFPDRVARLGTTVAVALVLGVFTAELLRRRRLRNTARFAAAFTAIALFLKLLVLLHPNMPVGDALFQAHRFQDVLRGNYYFTSIAPGNYLFPYAPGLYVAAAPFADFVRREAGDVVLLRIVVIATDAAAGLLLYPIVAACWNDRRAGAMAIALYHLLPLDFGIAAGGTLTSAFAQSLSVASLVLMSAPWLRIGHPAGVAALTVALAAAFMSHTSTFAILSVSSAAIAGVYWWRGGPLLRPAAIAVAAAGLAAVLLAVGLYYSHFIETYRTEFTRISGETAAAAGDAGGRSIAQRAMAVPRYVREYFGIPAVLLLLAGARDLWRRGSRDRLTLAVAGWGIACLIFLVIGVLTPVDMRYYLAALPAVAAVGAAGASQGWGAAGPPRLVTTVLLIWWILTGVGSWWNTLR